MIVIMNIFSFSLPKWAKNNHVRLAKEEFISWSLWLVNAVKLKYRKRLKYSRGAAVELSSIYEADKEQCQGEIQILGFTSAAVRTVQHCMNERTLLSCVINSAHFLYIQIIWISTFCIRYSPMKRHVTPLSVVNSNTALALRQEYHESNISQWMTSYIAVWIRPFSFVCHMWEEKPTTSAPDNRGWWCTETLRM